MRRRIWAISSIAFLVLAIFAPHLAAQEGSYGVQPGDQVTLDFFTAAGTRSQEIAGERTVDRNGEIFLPFLGTVSVLGQDAESIRGMLVTRYGAFFSNPVLQVVVRLRVNITGYVRQPGSYFVDPSSTVIDALAQAGGSSGEIDLGNVGGAADPSQVRLVRRSGELLILDLRPDQVTDEIRQLQIQSGDWIHVPPRAQSRFRDDLTFYGGILSVAATLAGLIVLIAR